MLEKYSNLLYNLSMNENMDLNKNTEIEKALKEFEEKSSAEQAKKAPEVSKNSDAPKMVQLVMKWSGVKEQRQAEYILLGFVVVAMIVSIFFWAKAFGK